MSRISIQPLAQTALRKGSKADHLRQLLTGKGASLERMIEATGWQAHTVRAAMTGLRKRGYQIDRRTDGGTTVWFIASGEAA